MNDLSAELDKTAVRFRLPPPAAFGRLFYIKATYIVSLKQVTNVVKTLVLDTNVFLTEANALFAFGKNNIAKNV